MAQKRRILIIYNKYEREFHYLTKIKANIQKCRPDFCVEIISAEESYEKALEYEPDLILTYYGASSEISVKYYVLKYLFGCQIIRLETEGLFRTYDENSVEAYMGHDDYGPGLFDYEIVWGNEIAKLFAERSILLGRMTDQSRVHVSGHPGFEEYSTEDCKRTKSIQSYIPEHFERYEKDSRIVFFSGFSYAEYTDEQLEGAKDLFTLEDKKNDTVRYRKALAMRKWSVIYRQRWCETIIESANVNKSMLHIVKVHPTETIIFNREGHHFYKEFFKDIDNVVCLESPCKVSDIIPHVSLAFHYGSTTSIECYIANVPPIFVSDNTIFEENVDLLETLAPGPQDPFGSQYRIDMRDVVTFVTSHGNHSRTFMRSLQGEEFLRKYLNYDISKPYTPITDIAAFIMKVIDEQPLMPDANDKRFISALEKYSDDIIPAIVAKATEAIPKEQFLKTAIHSKRLMLLASVLNMTQLDTNTLYGKSLLCLNAKREYQAILS